MERFKRRILYIGMNIHEIERIVKQCSIKNIHVEELRYT